MGNGDQSLHKWISLSESPLLPTCHSCMEICFMKLFDNVLNLINKSGLNPKQMATGLRGGLH
jgi:hypothetical protein